MARRLVACFFDRRPLGPFARMARVLEMTAQTHCADWTIAVERLPLEDRRAPSGVDAHAHNTQKLERWVESAIAQPDGTEVLLIDADTMILRAIDSVWDEPFDLAYTVKAAPFPFNLGVMFWRINARTRPVLQAWREENAALFAESQRDQTWRRAYGGINQAAFGRLHARGGLEGLGVRTVPCYEWNCEESGWDRFDADRVRIVHLKGELRRTVFCASRPKRTLAPIVTIWRELDEAAAHRGGMA